MRRWDMPNVITRTLNHSQKKFSVNPCPSLRRAAPSYRLIQTRSLALISSFLIGAITIFSNRYPTKGAPRASIFHSSDRPRADRHFSISGCLWTRSRNLDLFVVIFLVRLLDPVQRCPARRSPIRCPFMPAGVALELRVTEEIFPSESKAMVATKRAETPARLAKRSHFGFLCGASSNVDPALI